MIIRALTDPQPFSWEGKYYRYQTVSVWPGLIQRPHPPLYSTGNSFEPAAFAARQGHGLALSFAPCLILPRSSPTIEKRPPNRDGRRKKIKFSCAATSSRLTLMKKHSSWQVGSRDCLT